MKQKESFVNTSKVIYNYLQPKLELNSSCSKKNTTKGNSEVNGQLWESFTLEDIANALSHMCPTKIPIPNNLSAILFQRHWQTVRSGVVETCLHILNKQGKLESLNYTHIAFIPKIAKLKKVIEFSSINLYNVVYRNVVKAIANRLKLIFSQIVSPTQSVFIRLITDNVIIGYECYYKIRHSKKKKERSYHYQKNKKY